MNTKRYFMTCHDAFLPIKKRSEIHTDSIYHMSIFHYYYLDKKYYIELLFIEKINIFLIYQFFKYENIFFLLYFVIIFPKLEDGNKKNNKREKNSFFTNYIQKNLKNDNNLKTFKFSLMFSLNYSM